MGVIGTGGLYIRWWDQEPSDPYARLSDEEVRIVRAFASAAFPSTQAIALDGYDADLDRFFDTMLMHVPTPTAKLLKLLLHGLDSATVLTHGATFSTLEKSEKMQALEGWLQHDLAEVRNATQSLVLLLGMGWSTHPKVAPFMQRMHNCGYGA